MDDKQFDYFWAEIIFPAIKFCIDSMDDELKTSLGVCCRNLDKYKNDLSKMFRRKREWLKRNYLPEEGEDARLDFHKLSAILCRCIIGNKVFTFQKEEIEALFKKRHNDTSLSLAEKIQWEIDYIYVNYKLAFLVSLGVVYIYLLSWANKKIEESKNTATQKIYAHFLHFLNREGNLIFYKKSQDHDDFYTSMIVALMKNDMLKRDFDYLTYAASMFQLQEYTKQKIFAEILLNPDKNQGLSVSDINSLI